MCADKRQRLWTPVLVGVLALSADQLSKAWVVLALGPDPLARAVPIAGDWFQLIYAHNTGIAFSLFPGMPQLFTITSLLICAAAAYLYWTQLPNQQRSIQVAIGMIIGGALGNVADRIRLGYVVDFIQVGWWPVFNLADSAVCVGAALLALQLARSDAARRRQEHAAAP